MSGPRGLNWWSTNGRRAVVVVAALLLPMVVAFAFGHPTRRALLPAGVMFMIVVAATFIGGAVAGLVASVSSTVSLWFWNLPPAVSFRLHHGEDIAAVVMVGGISLALVATLQFLRERERRALRNAIEAEEARLADARTLGALQRAVLPTAPPRTRWLSIGCSYRTGGGSTNPVGGDWFAFVPLTDGRFGLAVGDVVGHGLAAVTTMAEYRYTLRALAAEGRPPDVVLARLDELSGYFHRRPWHTTCVYGIVDPSVPHWQFANAGHPPPILVRDGVARVLDGPNGPPIGALQGVHRYPNITIALEPGDVVVTYTDGLVERPDEPIDTGIARLAERCCAFVGEPAAMSDQLVDELVGADPRDDVAVVAFRIDLADQPTDVDHR